MATIKIEGVEQTKKAVKNLSRDMRQKVLSSTNRKVAKGVFEPIAKQKAEGLDVGDAIELSGSISTKKVRRSNAYAVRPRATGKYSKIPIVYGYHWFERGTAERKTKRGWHTGSISPHPFLKPAFDSGVTSAKMKWDESFTKSFASYKKRYNL